MLKRHGRRPEDGEFGTYFAVLAERHILEYSRQMFLMAVADYKIRKQAICVTQNDTSVKLSEGHILFNNYSSSPNGL